MLATLYDIFAVCYHYTMNKKTLHQQLEEYGRSGYLPMHMPGGKRRTGTFASHDITEISGFDDLHDPRGIIKELEEDIARLWHAGEAFVSVNGSTAMIESAICAAMRYCHEGKVLAASNCHLSVWHGIEMAGCKHKVIDPSCGDAPFAMEVKPEVIEEALKDDPSIRAVVITSPTYEGIISDTRETYEITRRYGCTLIIDEAHGAHLGLDDYWGQEACGDIVIKSLHKTLSAPTQTAVMLKYSDRIQTADIRHYIDIFESSSPSYLLMSGVSEAVTLLHQRDALREWEQAVSEAEKELLQLRNIRLFTTAGKDRSKFVLICRGRELADILRVRYKIETEASYDTHLIAMTGIGDTGDSLARFTAALTEADRDHPELALRGDYSFIPPVHIPEMTLAGASGHRSYKTDISKAEGKISGGFIYDYPPGIPVIMPGDMITPGIIERLSAEGIKEISVLDLEVEGNSPPL